jgi:hypothetical protein
VAPPSALIKLNKFQQASGCIDMVGLSDVCAHNQDGVRVENAVFPFLVDLEPTHIVNFTGIKKTNNQLLAELASIPIGSELFHVYAYASPLDKLNGTKTLLGSVTTSSACYQSLFGDENMFFRHQRMEEDFSLRPDWIEEMAQLGDPACVATTGPVSKWQCVPVPNASVSFPAAVATMASTKESRHFIDIN